MGLFETDDEWEEDWFERGVDKYEEKVEKQTEALEAAGLENAPEKEKSAYLDYLEEQSQLRNEGLGRHCTTWDKWSELYQKKYGNF